MELSELADVPDETDILIHPGSSVADTKGCILVGESTTASFLTNSRYWVDKIIEEIRNGSYFFDRNSSKVLK